MRQDRVMEIEGGELELVSSCHRLNCKSMVFISSVPYMWQAVIHSRIQLFLWFKDKKPYCLPSAVENGSKCCKLLIAIGHENYPVHWSLMFRCDWVENFLSYWLAVRLFTKHHCEWDSPDLILYQTPRKWKVHDPEMDIWEMTQKKKSIHVPRETIRRENFLNCQPA